NVQMRPNADSTIWTCEEMWHITDAYSRMQIKATMFSGPEYSPTDEGIDIPGWSVFVTGTSVPLSTDHNQHVTGGMDGWARIHTDSSQINGYMEFILANPRYHIHYNYNGLLGIHMPDQYPENGATTVTVEKSRLVNGFNFTGWNTKADGSGRTYQPGDVFDFTSRPEGVTLEHNDSILTLYAQGSYTGTYHVAISFEHSNGKRYFLTQPIGETNRYVRARPVGDWTNTYQGMSDPYNREPNYINTYKLIGGPDPCGECNSGEYLLDPRREWRYGAKDSLLFYSNFAPASDVYLGLYYDDRSTPFEDPVTIVANSTWAGIFTSTAGWPDYRVADVQGTKLKSEDYLDGFPSAIARHERPSSDSSFVYYNEALDQFDGVETEGEATTFQISRVRVADEHYVVLPDTTKTWRDTIEFGYHSGEQSRERVWTSMIGKQLLAVTKVGNDTVYFHPDPDHIIQDPNNLYLDKNYRVSQVFEFIPDSRVRTAVAEEDRATHETTSYQWHNDIVSGLNSPIGVKDGEGNYIDIVDTFRITMSHGGISKVKQYYGRWKNGAAGLKVNGDGSVRTRDVIVRTKTYHYGDTITHLVLKPEFKSYIFNPLKGNSQVINFTLANVKAHRLLDVNGNEVGEEEVSSSEDITESLRLGPSVCRFSSGGTYFKIVEGGAVLQHVTLAAIEENKLYDNHDTLIISMDVTYGGKVHSVTASVPLVQTSLKGDELIWSVQSGNKRYYIMAGTGGLIFRQFALKDGTLYKNDGKNRTVLVKGSANATNSDDKYITPWSFIYNPENPNQLALKTGDLVNRYFNIDGGTPGVHPDDSSLLTFHYVDVLTNDNANEEELVKLQYGADKWLQFRLTGGSGAELRLVDSKDSASVFSWSYLNQEYSLLNNGAYPDRDTVIFGYDANVSVAIRAPYKAYKEYSMLVGNSVVYCCREEETDLSNLQSSSLEWKTNQTFSLIPDARDFDGEGDEPESGISLTGSTVSTSDDSPRNVTIGGKYVNIVDTLRVTLSLQTGAPAYRFKGDWSGFRSVSDAELKIPLIRKTYHEANYDSLVCVVEDDVYNHTFPNEIDPLNPESFIFNLGTKNRTGRHVLDVANMTLEVLDGDETDVTVSGRMDLSSTAMAEVLLVDEYGNTPTWCRISGKTATSITVQCTQSGIRTPRTAYLRIFYIVMINSKMYVVTEQLTVSQPSYFQYANNQHLVHSPGASGDPLRADGMQQVHENKRILYYYPDQDVELPIRDYHFFGWWRWFREGAGEIGDSDIPEASWRKKPQNTGSGRSGSYNFPFLIIGDSVKVPNTETPAPDDSIKVLVTMGRYTVFHYKAADYNDNKKNPPVKV
ncbi:MAG: InlB B-repeat-containing protein, partial [Paludibacteraceae bacterium]|nr:InlB B-repeat-containing protein [Paludibacteraceae bacterium]